eukprot:TRINITY_DN3003_c0_g1_i11.p3 TRINITY_DN3003_c0_g1~~TRINITY_DN3003_c0_g1_i11.p3  ORF type:complete len:140 (-),score=3.19 TRINITY_DN3003_c0_g1_i11:297-716(-)
MSRKKLTSLDATFFCTFLQCRQEVFEFWLKNCKSRGYQIYFAEKEIKLSLFLSVFVAPLQGLIFDIVFAGTIYICLKLKTLFSMQQANVFDVNFRQIIEIKMFFQELIQLQLIYVQQQYKQKQVYEIENKQHCFFARFL